MGRQNAGRQWLPEGFGVERRASVRFQLDLEVHYPVAGRRGQVETGSGRIIDISSSGMRFATERSLEPGRRLEVSIDWPVLLDGEVQLQLWMSGMVIRANGTEAAMRIERHEFRTRRAVLKVATHEASV